MVDIAAYVEYEKYMKYQLTMPDYTKAIEKALELANTFVVGNDIVVSDFCCGTGSNTKRFAERRGGIAKAILIDINKGFLDIAHSSEIKAKEIRIKHEDILKVQLVKESDVVLSLRTIMFPMTKNNGILIRSKVHLREEELLF